MKKHIITLYPIEHWHNPEGKEKIRLTLLKQGYYVESGFDGSLKVYEKGARMPQDWFSFVLVALLVFSVYGALYLILEALK